MKIEEVKERFRLMDNICFSDIIELTDKIERLISEVERLRQLVKSAYVEGWNDFDEIYDENGKDAWKDSRAKKQLTVIQR